MEKDNLFMSAEDIALVTVRLNSTLISWLHSELEAKGYFTIRGRISKQYFEERFYGITE